MSAHTVRWQSNRLARRFTPLHLAAMMKNGYECIQTLLYYDHVDVDAKDRLQRTPIMYAIINGVDSKMIGTLCSSFACVLSFSFRSAPDEMQEFRCRGSHEKQHPALRLHRGTTLVERRTRICFFFRRRTSQWWKVCCDETRRRRSSKRSMMRSKRETLSRSLMCTACDRRPLELAKKAQMSPSIIDTLFSLSGRF